MSTLETASQPLEASITPPLVAGDRLSRAEFERRYRAMPQVKKAELIEGVVYMPSPVSIEGHGSPHFHLIGWLALYEAATKGVQGGDNSTVRLDLDNEPQPDAFLRILPEFGGQSATVDGYVEGAPELVAEIASTTASYDLHDKMNAYRRNGVGEYLVWRVQDRQIDWFVLRDDQFVRVEAADGRYRSEAFPGLWLDADSLLAGDLPRVMAFAQEGTVSEEHSAFAVQLQEAGRK